MVTSEASNAARAVRTVDALHLLKDLVRQDPAFAKALRATTTTEQAVRLAAEYGISVSPEALWRNRGTLVSGGATWRG